MKRNVAAGYFVNTERNDVEVTTTPEDQTNPLFQLTSLLTTTQKNYLLLHIKPIPDICHFFTLAKFLEKKIYTEKNT